MGEFVLDVLALTFIWIGWGFWVFLSVFAARIVSRFLFKPKYGWETNWAVIIGKIATLIVAFFAIQDKWENPVITAIAIATTLIIIVVGK